MIINWLPHKVRTSSLDQTLVHASESVNGKLQGVKVLGKNLSMGVHGSEPAYLNNCTTTTKYMVMV